MYKYFVMLTLLLVGASSATAATWYGFNKAYNDQSLYYFDADTVIKKGDTITFWTKYVTNGKQPESDGSYSTAQKVEYSCKKRVSRTLSSSIYDVNRQFIRSYGASNKINEIAPDTIGEAILTAVCTADFPKNKKSELYYPVNENDIYKHTANFYKFQEKENTDLAPTAATWNAFVYGSNDYKGYYFDANSVNKTKDGVAFWMKYVNNVKHPDNDGGYSTAQNVEFSCSNNTIQVFNSSIYDKDGKFIKAYPNPEKLIDIKPNTLFNSMLTAVCTPDFPLNKSKAQYYLVEDNDIYRDSTSYYRSIEEKQTDNAPK